MRLSPRLVAPAVFAVATALAVMGATWAAGVIVGMNSSS